MRGTYERRVWEAHPELTHAPPRLRRACEYDVFLPEPLETETYGLPEELAAVVSDAEVAISQLNHSAPMLAPLARLLLRTESIASSKVEGLQVDAKQLARAEVRDETGQKASAEALEILANVDAMQFAIEETAGARRITPYAILDVHRVLMARRHPKMAGRLRDVQNWIGGNDFNPCGADFVPPPPELVDPLLQDLCRFAERDDIPTLVQAALLHAQFETIHPFEDGNGRTGRALVQVVFRRRGLAPGFVPPVSIVLAREKERYIRGLTSYRNGDVLVWIETFSVAVAEACNFAKGYLECVRKVQDEWRARLNEAVRPRSDAAAWALIDVLPAHPVVTLPVGVAATSRSKPAVNGAIPQLVDAGVLRPLSQSKRNRAWEASDLLDLIVDMEEGVPAPLTHR
ncbi:MAG: Fic family protein [Actinomycetota bacterium]|nr:Fic family protein [Actinomycetota bacterium]